MGECAKLNWRTVHGGAGAQPDDLEMMIEITDKGREYLQWRGTLPYIPSPKKILMPQRPTSILTTLAVSLLALTLIAPWVLGQDPDRLAEIRRRAEQGDAVAQFDLALMYANSDGLSEDAAEAVRWFRQAAEQGLAGAQYNLGVMYANGDGVPEDKAEAVQWYRQAAEQGFTEAQYTLGVMYDNGQGVPEDDAEAVKWYRRAAEQGKKAEAQLSLGRMNYNGEGGPKNNAEAVKWFRLSAEQGNAEAQLGLGILYEQGWGVPEDYVLAYAWYNLASAQGNEQARDIKDDLRTRMTPDQIAQAQEMSATLFDRIN